MCLPVTLMMKIKLTLFFNSLKFSNKLRWPDLPADAFAFTGNRGQVVMMIPSLDAVLVRMGWSARYYPRNERFAAWLRNARDG